MLFYLACATWFYVAKLDPIMLYVLLRARASDSESLSFNSLQLEIGHPKFPAGSKAACVDLTSTAYIPGSEIRDIEYFAEDDIAIEQFLRENISTTWHSLGTAKMAPRDQMGVVDLDLSVYGVQGLKLVDLSIAPENVGTNTNNTAMAIGEKGADIIAKELGLIKGGFGKSILPN